MVSFDSPGFRAYVLNAMQALQVPGLSLAVIQNDEVVFSAGYGARDYATGAAVDEHTTFAIASISKSFTATALAMLVDAGKLAWNDRVTDILPDFRLMDAFATQEIRVRDLLIHNSGLGEVSGGTIWYGSDLDRAEVVRRLRFLRPRSSFRSTFAYQNVMYLVAGQIVSALSGQSWDDFIQQRIFDPLGMADSSPNLARAWAHANMAAPHAPLPYGSSGAMEAIPHRDHDNVGPAASLYASAWDLAQYLRLHIRRGAYGAEQIINPRTAAELHAAQIATANPSGPAVLAKVAPRFSAYGLGWRMQDYRGCKLVYHAGGVDGMRTLISILPEQGLGVVALTNAEAPLTYPLTNHIFDQLLGVDERDFDWVEVYRQVESDYAQREDAAEAARLSARVSGTPPALAHAALAGRYTNPLIDAVQVNADGGHLSLCFAHTPAFTADLEHWHYNTYRLHWRDPYVPWGLVTFHQDARGAVQALEFDQPALLDVDFSELGPLVKE